MASGGGEGLRLGEFVALVALLISLVALSIDAMLPALPAIAVDLGVAAGNRVQLVVMVLILGLGIGQLAYGPLSDSFGRKPAILAGLGLFMAGCLVSLLAASFEAMLLGRLLQGLGVAGPRIVVVALVRDCYRGRAMARVMSSVMAVFILVPTVAPALGQGIMVVASWRAIFATFLAIAALAAAWFALRQPETLPPERRAPLSARGVARGVAEVCAEPVALGHTLAAGLILAPFLGYLSSAQQIFQQTYRVGRAFPAYFAVLALAIGSASLVNSRLVMRLGMRRLARGAAGTLALLSALFWVHALGAGGVPALAALMAYLMAAFFCVGVLFGNLNAIAMEPLGHLAGVGAAVVGSLATAISVPLGTLVGHAYDGTVLGLVGAFAVFPAGALAAMRWAARARGGARG